MALSMITCRDPIGPSACARGGAWREGGRAALAVAVCPSTIIGLFCKIKSKITCKYVLIKATIGCHRERRPLQIFTARLCSV